MSTKKKSATPPAPKAKAATPKPKTEKTAVIEWLPLESLVAVPGFNPRTPESFKRNVDELAAMIAARGGIDASIHCVQYVERDGKKLIRNGHTLAEAAKRLKLKTVPAIATDLDETSELVNLVTSNAGHPLSQYEQGEVFIRLRDAEGAPKTAAEIAKAVGVSATHVSNCLAMREAPPAVRELIESGKISPNAFTAARKNVKDDKTLLAILEAAIVQAADQKKDCATDKHVREVKDRFCEPKLKAGKTKGTPPETFKKSGGEKSDVGGIGDLGGSEPSERNEPDDDLVGRDAGKPEPRKPEGKKSETRAAVLAIIEAGRFGSKTDGELTEEILAVLFPF